MWWLASALMMLGLPYGALAAEKPKSCWDKAQTPDELRRCADAECGAADHELTRVYQQILQKYADAPGFIAKLKAAQAAWVKFRDVEMQALFPPGDDKQGGSVLPMCIATSKTRLTEERTRALHRWLDGRDEGDVCGGSAKTKAELKTPPQSAPPKRAPAKGAAAAPPPPARRK